MSNKEQHRAPRCVGIGEVLWDCLPSGRRLGGAPANVAAHAAQLGVAATLVSAVGDDADGREIVAQLRAMGVDTAGVRIARGLPTGRVDVTLDAAGVPAFAIAFPSAWDALSFDAALERLANTADAVVFGTLAQRDERSRRAIRAFLAAVRPECLKVFDVNLRPPFFTAEAVRDSLARADVLKLNETELPTVAEIAGVGTASDPLRALRELFDLRCAVCTFGERGSRIVSADEDFRRPGRPVEVVDTVGAGDAFTAALSVGLLRGWPLDRSQEWANRVAAFVCTQAGAVPRLPKMLSDAFRKSYSQEQQGTRRP